MVLPDLLYPGLYEGAAANEPTPGLITDARISVAHAS